MNKFWNWKEPDAESGERVLEMNGTIASESWFDDDVTPQMFHDELFAGTGPVTLWLNSPGGDCIAASQIYSMMMDYKDEITVKIDGIAASAASVIAMAGTVVLMAPTALMMIHNPMTIAFGDHGDMQKAIDILSEVKESIINAYEIKTGLSRKKLSDLMEAETWMNAGKAVELGFADAIIGGSGLENVVSSFQFSQRATESDLMDKVVAKAKAQSVIEHEKHADDKQPVDVKTGRSVKALMDKLNAVMKLI